MNSITKTKNIPTKIEITAERATIRRFLGLIGDLGFYNWFPITIKDRLYKIKMSLKPNFS